MNAIVKNHANITYRTVGDYNIPNLTLPPEEANIKLGKWGMLYKDYLMKHKKVLFTTLLTQGKLYQHCAEVEKQATDMFDTLIEQMKKAESATEQLKEDNQFEWIAMTNNIQSKGTEIVIHDIICN